MEYKKKEVEKSEIDNKKILIEISIVVLILLVAGYFVFLNKAEKPNIEEENFVIQDENYVPTLEEIAEQEGKSLEDLLPEKEHVPTLEEIAEQEGKSLEDLLPTASEVPTLEEMEEEKLSQDSLQE